MLINKILIVGYGSIGKRHFRLVKEKFPLADIRFFRHQRLNQRDVNDHLFIYDEGGLHKFSPQVAVIANPAPFHIEMAMVLVEMGVHLLIEKPLSNSIDGIEGLLKLAQKKNVFLMVGYNLRYLPSLNYFKDCIANQLIGPIMAIDVQCGQYLPDWRPNNDYRTGVTANKNLGGGVLLELSHEIDYVNWIFGEMTWVKAGLFKKSMLEVDVEDIACIIFGCKSTLSRTGEICGTLHLDFIRQDSVRSCTAVGELGTIRWNGSKNSVELFSVTDGLWKVLYEASIDRDESYRAEWENFINVVNFLETPKVTILEGLYVLRVVEACKRASALGIEIV